MATYTAGDQINRALRLLGVLAEDETPSASTSNDALVALNQMIDIYATGLFLAKNDDGSSLEIESNVSLVNMDFEEFITR